MPTRRIFVRNSALLIAGAAALPGWLSRAVSGSDRTPRRKKALVAVFLRGAADGLNIAVPHGEKRYYELRPTIAVPPPSSAGNECALDLDGFFGLHPALAPVLPLFQQRHLAIVHAAGSPDPTRSHFDAQDYMESGTPGMKATHDGWINRAIMDGTGRASPLRAVTIGPVLPRALRGHHAAVALQNIGDFAIRDTQAARAFEALYRSSPDRAIQIAGAETFEAASLLETVRQRADPPPRGALYPPGRLGANLRQVAQLIKADVGVEVAFLDVSGWDHHVNEVGATPMQGQLANLLTELGKGLAAFWTDLGDRMEDVVVVTMSEFGRTARENGNRGTDHGHANCMFVLGGRVRGGRIYGKWPGLEPEQLYEGRDLALTTDFRDVFGELVYYHLGNQNLERVFPGYNNGRQAFPGILQTI